MTRYLLILFLLLLLPACSESDANPFMGLMSGSVPVAEPPSGCASGDLINETWDTNPGEDLTWADTGTTPDPDSTGHSFTGGSGQVLYIAADTENEALYQTYTHSGDVTTSYHRVKFYIASESMATTEYSRLLELANTDDTYILRVNVTDTAGQLSIDLAWRSYTSGVITYNINVTTEYTLEIYRTTNAFAWKVNGTTVEASGVHAAAQTWGKTHMGVKTYTTSTNLMNVYYECYGVSTAGWVGD